MGVFFTILAGPAGKCSRKRLAGEVPGPTVHRGFAYYTMLQLLLLWLVLAHRYLSAILYVSTYILRSSSWDAGSARPGNFVSRKCHKHENIMPVCLHMVSLPCGAMGIRKSILLALCIGLLNASHIMNATMVHERQINAGYSLRYTKGPELMNHWVYLCMRCEKRSADPAMWDPLHANAWWYCT